MNKVHVREKALFSMTVKEDLTEKFKTMRTAATRVLFGMILKGIVAVW